MYKPCVPVHFNPLQRAKLGSLLEKNKCQVLSQSDGSFLQAPSTNRPASWLGAQSRPPAPGTKLGVHGRPVERHPSPARSGDQGESEAAERATEASRRGAAVNAASGCVLSAEEGVWELGFVT